MVKHHIALGAGSAGEGRFLPFFLLVQELEHPLRCGQHALDYTAHLSKAGDGLGKHMDILGKRQDVSHLNGPLGSKDGAREHGNHIAQVVDKGHDGVHEAREEHAFPAGLVEFFIGFVKEGFGLILPVEGFDQLMTGKVLLHLGGYLAQAFLLLLEVFAAHLKHHGDHHAGQGYNQ